MDVNTRQKYVDDVREVNAALSNFLKGMKMLNTMVKRTGTYPSSVSLIYDVEEEDVGILANWEFMHLMIYKSGMVTSTIKGSEELRIAREFKISRYETWSTDEEVPDEFIRYLVNRSDML